MKKIFAILLVALMCVSLLAGCGKSEEEKAREEIENALKEEMGDEAWGELQDEIQAGAELDKEIAEKDKENADTAAQQNTLKENHSNALRAFSEVDYTTISKDELQTIIDNYKKAYEEYYNFMKTTYVDMDETLLRRDCSTDITEDEEKLAFKLQEIANDGTPHKYIFNTTTNDYIIICNTNEQSDPSLQYLKGYFITPEYDRIDYDFTNENYTNIYFSAIDHNIIYVGYDIEDDLYGGSITLDLSTGTPVIVDEPDTSGKEGVYYEYDNSDFAVINASIINN